MDNQLLNVWVNHFRRETAWHQEIRSNYLCHQTVDVTFEGPDIGIACNISHIIDLINFWNNEVPVSVDCSKLKSIWHNSKRSGFKEIDGELICLFSGGSKVRVVSDTSIAQKKIYGRLISTDTIFNLDEAAGIFSINNVQSVYGRNPFQSELTGGIFDNLCKYNKCDLTPFSIAFNCYRPIINSLLLHWKSTPQGKDDFYVPLT